MRALPLSVSNIRLVSLLHSAGTGDTRAFREVHALSGCILFACALRIVRRPDAADEVIQESLIAIWREAANFNPVLSAPLTWMTRIVRNKAIDFIRSASTRDDYLDGDAEAMNIRDPAIGPCELLELRQQNNQIRLGLAKLEWRQREAIELAFYQDMSHIEVASAMTVPLGTAKTWIRRGCQQMRRELVRV